MSRKIWSFQSNLQSIFHKYYIYLIANYADKYVIRAVLKKTAFFYDILSMYRKKGMYLSLSMRMAESLQKHNVIQEKDVDICRYGLEIFLSSAFETLSIFIISILLGNYFETFCFFLAFIPLRIWSGGYHANTKMGCYFVSIFVYIGFSIITQLVAVKYLVVTNIIMTVSAMILVYRLSPIIHFNKNVTNVEKILYRKKSILTCFFQGIIIIGGTVFLNKNLYIFSFACGQVASALALLSAYLLERNKFSLNNS